MSVSSSNAIFQFPSCDAETVTFSRIWTTLATIPPTMVVLPPGSGAGSRTGSWPSVARAPEEVAELSSISVLGDGGSTSLLAGANGVAIAGCCRELGFPVCVPPTPTVDCGCASLLPGTAGGVTLGAGVAGGGAVCGWEGFPAWVPPKGVLGVPEPDCGSGFVACEQSATEESSRIANTRIGERFIDYSASAVRRGRWLQRNLDAS